MKFWTSKAPRLLRWSCYSRNVPWQSLDLENPPTALHLQDASSPHSPWSWPHQASNKLRRVLASQEQLKDWYHGGKSPHRWDCTYLIKVTCQVTQRDFLCGYLCCDPAIAYKHREHFKYVSFPSQSARGLNSTSIVSAGSPGNQILLTRIERKKKMKMSQKHLSSKTGLPLEKNTVNTTFQTSP